MHTNEKALDDEVCLRLAETLATHYDEYKQKASVFLRNATDAEDAVQNACLKAWRYRNKLRNLASCHSWVNRILYVECIAIAKKRTEKWDLPFDPQAQDVLSSDNFENTSVDKWLIETILSELDEKYRVPVFLFYLGGYPTKQIAAKLQMDDSIIRHRIYYAKKLIQQRFPDLE